MFLTIRDELRDASKVIKRCPFYLTHKKSSLLLQNLLKIPRVVYPFYCRVEFCAFRKAPKSLFLIFIPFLPTAIFGRSLTSEFIKVFYKIIGVVIPH